MTDNPLKILITNAKEAFASWLLGREVTTVRPINVEFPARGARADLLFVIEDPPRTILHLELQSSSSARPMPLRELEYITRTVDAEIGVPTSVTPRLHSVVIYIGEGAGSNDTGHYNVLGIDDTITLQWHYTVIHLWKMTPQWLQSLEQPALLALAGQTKLTEPETELAETLTQIRQIEDKSLREHIIASFASLLPSREVIAMMEAYLESDEQWVLELPYLQMIREKAIKEGLTEGRAEGAVRALRKAILGGVVERFDPASRIYVRLERQLEQIDQAEALQSMLIKLFSMEDVEILLASVEKQIQAQDALSG